ncbi:MAG: hypothetical protein GX207_07730 [Peptococcaceae bacterium]|nr:hypothetical protein [Peptococcaceae bacterium]NLM21619.1 hypothetical protein [Peptococcaceae bacterium]
MLKRVLFSTLGMTDPMKNDFDGPMLHILRHYRPQKVYLFMTKRVCELAEQDNRYRLQIEYLCKQENFNCEIIELRYENIDKPQQFDLFYPLFEKELIKIHQENPSSQLLINLSSGTPQMKSTCHLLALTLGFPVVPIQVTTPNEQENYGMPIFDVDLHWKNNLDNHPDMGIKNRCTVVEFTNLRYLFLREAAINYIRAFEYKAAFTVLQPVREFVSASALHLLQAAVYRKNMELSAAEKEARLAGYDLFPVKSGDVEELFEYLLVLQIQQQTGDLMNFVRGISPALSKLFEGFLEEKCRRKVKTDYCYRSGRNRDIYKISREKLAREPALLACYDRCFESQYQDSFLACSSLLPMIIFDCGAGGAYADPEVVERAEKLRAVEEEIRNTAAHTITAVTEKQFTKIAGLSSKQVMEMLVWFFEKTYPQHIPNRSKCWESYKIMNEDIIRQLK